MALLQFFLIKFWSPPLVFNIKPEITFIKQNHLLRWIIDIKSKAIDAQMDFFNRYVKRTLCNVCGARILLRAYDFCRKDFGFKYRKPLLVKKAEDYQKFGAGLVMLLYPSFAMFHCQWYQLIAVSDGLNLHVCGWKGLLQKYQPQDVRLNLEKWDTHFPIFQWRVQTNKHMMDGFYDDYSFHNMNQINSLHGFLEPKEGQTQDSPGASS